MARKKLVRVDPSIRFNKKFERKGANECWPWHGSTNASGRGIFWFGDRLVTAPRVALILSGIEIPEGHMACHHCDNKNCVNPSHLYVGTYTTNLIDAYARGQNKRSNHSMPGETHPSAKTTDKDVIEMRRMHSQGGMRLKDIGAVFGLQPTTVFNIVHRHTWKHIV